MGDPAHARKTAQRFVRAARRQRHHLRARLRLALPGRAAGAVRGGRRARAADRQRARGLQPQPAARARGHAGAGVRRQPRRCSSAGTASAGCATRSRRASASPATRRCSRPAAPSSTRTRPRCSRATSTRARARSSSCASCSRSARDYVGTYEDAGLLRECSVLAHNVHVSDDELDRLAAAKTAVAHCPSSNAFLSSGIFAMAQHVEHGVRFGMGTDVGAGTGLSMLKEGLVAYHVQMVREQGHMLGPAHLLYLATAAGADALGHGRHHRRPDPRQGRRPVPAASAGRAARSRPCSRTARTGRPRSARSSRSRARSRCSRSASAATSCSAARPIRSA